GLPKIDASFVLPPCARISVSCSSIIPASCRRHDPQHCYFLTRPSPRLLHVTSLRRIIIGYFNRHPVQVSERKSCKGRAEEKGLLQDNKSWQTSDQQLDSGGVLRRRPTRHAWVRPNLCLESCSVLGRK
ncbi:unnamed protein product, partial [Ectocarpus sp. 4 AP-2014]